jgi:hypothetical protein
MKEDRVVVCILVVVHTSTGTLASYPTGRYLPKHRIRNRRTCDPGTRVPGTRVPVGTYMYSMNMDTGTIHDLVLPAIWNGMDTIFVSGTRVPRTEYTPANFVPDLPGRY